MTMAEKIKVHDEIVKADNNRWNPSADEVFSRLLDLLDGRNVVTRSRRANTPLLSSGFGSIRDGMRKRTERLLWSVGIVLSSKAVSSRQAKWR